MVRRLTAVLPGSRRAGLPLRLAFVKRLVSPIPLIVLAGVLALVALLAYGLVSNKTSESPSSALLNKVAPTPVLPTLDGPGKSSLAAYKGKVVVLNYWASWCDPCRAEAPLLERWQQRIQSKGGTVLGVDVLDVAGDARAFVNKYGLTYPILRDGDGSSQTAYGILAYPESFVIGRDGRIAAAKRGVVNDQFMRQSVLPLLAKRS
jgi:cytochrome c biogenesis protein CcmG, thiol:disulfide interchange protein DsbE